jgi:triosephosphate isomerase
MKKLIAANWKMHKSQEEARSHMVALSAAVGPLPSDREVAVFAPFTTLHACAPLVPPGFHLGGQNCHPAANGAYTGEISAAMLKDAGCAMVLAGHSERRALFGESDAFVGEKTAAALAAGLHCVLCVGETLEEREGGKLAAVLHRQLEAAVPSGEKATAEFFSVAYEPVWAIGTGKVAGPKEILESHLVVRDFLVKKLGAAGSAIRILYGGSVKPENTAEILGLDNVDGVLVGGASLSVESFSRIALA